MFLEIFSQMDTALLSEIFLIFNVSGDGSMNIQEFVLCWNMWIKKVPVLKISNTHLKNMQNCWNMWIIKVPPGSQNLKYLF